MKSISRQPVLQSATNFSQEKLKKLTYRVAFIKCYQYESMSKVILMKTFLNLRKKTQ